MTKTPHTMNQLATTGKPIAGFGRTSTATWVAISLALHLALIVGTSMGYIHDRWIDPEGAAARVAESEARAAAAKAAAKAAKAPTTAPAPTATAGAPTTKAAKPADSSDEELLKAHGDAPVVKRSTEVSKPGDIPQKPDDLGISIEDTNKK